MATYMAIIAPVQLIGIPCSSLLAQSLLRHCRERWPEVVLEVGLSASHVEDNCRGFDQSVRNFLGFRLCRAHYGLERFESLNGQLLSRTLMSAS